MKHFSAHWNGYEIYSTINLTNVLWYSYSAHFVDHQNGEQEIESFEPEENEGLTNGDMVETLNVAETTNGHKSENSGSDSTSSSSSDDHDEIEVNDEVPVYDREFPKSYAQLVTPSGFNPGAGLEVANDNVPEGDFE